MPRLNRSAVTRAAVVGIAVILALAAAAALLAPRLIARAGVRERLVTQLAAQLGAQVDLASLRVSLLPLPHVVLEQLRLSAPTVNATIDSVAIYPSLRALLSGRLQLAQAGITGANVQLHLAHDAAAEPAIGNATPRQPLQAGVSAALATAAALAAAYAPGSALRVTQGALSVTADGAEPITFTDMHGTVQLPAEELSVDLAAASNLWEQAALHAAIDPASVRGSGRLTVTGLRPHIIGRYLMPADLEVGTATANLDARFTADGVDAVHADVEATAPMLLLRRAAEHLTLGDAHVGASLTMEGESISMVLNSLDLAIPPLQLSGTLLLNRAVPQARLGVNGKDLNVSNAHEAAVFFAGPNPTVRAIFDILQAGTVPQLSVQAQGATLRDLASLDALLIRGALVGGQVRLPGNGLELADVSGDVSVVNGVLVGEHATGRLGNSQARDGSVRVGLIGESGELSVTTAVQADVSDLPAVLKRVVRNDTLTRTLDQLTDVQGRAEGELKLRGTTDAATATVDVSQLSMSTRARDLKQPVQIEGGQVHYAAAVIAATDLKITTGDSAMSQLSVRVDTSPAAPIIDVGGASGRVALAEIYPWVAASGWLPESAWTPKTLAGTLAVDSVRVRGPAARPNEWRVDLTGAARGLDIAAPRLQQVSAVRFPVSLSNLRLARDPAAIAVSVGVAAAGGLSGDVDVRWTAAGLDVKRLSVRDDHSDATLSLGLKERELDLAFAGSLDTATLEALLPEEHDVPRLMRGDFRARILIDQPMRSTAKGRLEVRHVTVPGPGDLRWDIAHAELRASGGMLAIDAEGDVSNGPLLHVHGALRPAAAALVADLDVSAGRLEWSRLAPLLPPAGSGAQSTPPAGRSLPVRGKLRINAESFSYGGYTWRPVKAVVDLSGRKPSLTVTQATLCRIATPGTIAMTPEGVRLLFKPAVKNQPLDEMLACLVAAPPRVDGQCSLTAQIDAAGRGSDLLTSARGHAHLSAAKGRVYQGGVIEKVLAVMSVGHGSWNIFADLTDDGLPYNTIDVKGDFRDGKLVLTEASMDAPSMKMAGEGSIDVRAGTIDVTLLAAPLKTVDMVVSRIPILGNILGGSLLTIPIKVKGRLEDPQVTPLDPSEVGSGLVRVMTRIVKLPLQLLDPFLPSDRTPQ